MNQILNQLKKKAEEHQMAIFITNQVTADPGASMFMASQAKAVGGNIMMHACDHIVQLRKGKGDQRIAKIVDSPWCAACSRCTLVATRTYHPACLTLVPRPVAADPRRRRPSASPWAA